MNTWWFKLRSAIGRRLGNRWVQLLLALKTEWRFAELYGDFHFGQSLDKYTVKGLAQESGKLYGALVKFLADIPAPPTRVLLPGENNAVKPAYARLLRLDESAILTAGVLNDMDVPWDFEHDPPAVGRLAGDPYHDAGLRLSPVPGGLLPLLPGLVRGNRQPPGLEIGDKYIHNSRITYKYRKRT